jgi:hypothetical protein
MKRSPRYEKAESRFDKLLDSLKESEWSVVWTGIAFVAVLILGFWLGMKV